MLNTHSGYKNRLLTCWFSAYFYLLGSQRVAKINTWPFFSGANVALFSPACKS